jgi:FkbM family methyltransferase
MITRLKQAVSRVMDGLQPKIRLRLPRRMHDVLADHPLTIADVGAAMGPDSRWQVLGEKEVRFIVFEPDTRSQDKPLLNNNARCLSFPTALSDRRGEQMLYLTSAPFASSIYRHNSDLLRSFLVWPWHEPAGEATVQVDTLQNCIDTHPDWQPDFLKVDTEGADLDVLRGAGRVIDSLLGLQVEVSFQRRHLGAPFFADIDVFLRDRGFVLYHLNREHWLRTNFTLAANTRPQLIWADAVYFPSSKRIFELLSQPSTEIILTKLVVLFLAYGAHDFAQEIVLHSIERGLINETIGAQMKAAIAGSAISTSSHLVRAAGASLIAASLFVAVLPFGRRARQASLQLLRRQSAPLFAQLARQSMRAGPGGGCISDPD